MGGGVEGGEAQCRSDLPWNPAQGQWTDASDAAEFWGCPGLSNRVPFALAGEVGAPSYNAPEALAEEFEFLHVDCEINPFGGVFNERKPFFNEVLSFHKPSRTLFVTDLFWNYGTDCGLEAGSQVWKFLVSGGSAHAAGAWPRRPTD